MKYKVGDKVRVKSIEWYEAMDKDDSGCIRYYNGTFIEKMKTCCGKEAVVEWVGKDYYSLDIDKGRWCWYGWTLEDGFEVKKDKDLIPNVLNAESLAEKRFHAACYAMNGIVSGLMQSEEWHGWTEKYITERAYLLADELLKQGGFSE